MESKVSMRTCVGCRKRAPRAELLKAAMVRQGDRETVVFDRTRRLEGRGASLHPDPSCLDTALQRGSLTRALRMQGRLDPAVLRDEFTYATTRSRPPIES